MFTAKKVLITFTTTVVGIIVFWLLASLYLTSQASTLVFQNQVSWASIPASPSLNYKLNWEKNQASQNFSIWEFINTTAPTDQYLIYYHGNAGRLLNFFPELTKNYNVISPSYNGFSESEGSPSVEATYEVALKTYDWLVAKGIPESKITIFGHSMGGSPAVYTASKKPNAKQLVLVNTFSSVQSMCIRQYGPFCVFSGSIFNSAQNARNVTIPVRQFAYKGDTTVPYDEAGKLFDSFEKVNDKKMIDLPGFTHSYPDFDIILKNI
jgi:uncharacterized protein